MYNFFPSPFRFFCCCFSRGIISLMRFLHDNENYSDWMSGGIYLPWENSNVVNYLDSCRWSFRLDQLSSVLGISDQPSPGPKGFEIKDQYYCWQSDQSNNGIHIWACVEAAAYITATNIHSISFTFSPSQVSSLCEKRIFIFFMLHVGGGRSKWCKSICKYFIKSLWFKLILRLFLEWLEKVWI